MIDLVSNGEVGQHKALFWRHYPVHEGVRGQLVTWYMGEQAGCRARHQHEVTAVVLELGR